MAAARMGKSCLGFREGKWQEARDTYQECLEFFGSIDAT